MKLKNIKLNDLFVNKSNDRHGELENETAAIAWLFHMREIHMKNLALDIVEQGAIYDPPLVTSSSLGSGYTVFDGNRRVTCIKLLKEPSKAPTTQLQSFFEELRQKWPGTFPDHIQCQVEEDRDRIDRILFRRHTGTQKGVGQVTWDDRMKSNFVTRTGKETGLNIAEEIETRLFENGFRSESSKKIPRSNINRLLSSDYLRNRVGFSVKKNVFEFTHDPDIALKTLSRIANDMAESKVVLGDIWNIAGKRAYLDRLDKEGVLPTAEDLLPEGEKIVSKSKRNQRKTSSKSSSKPDRRTSLIPQKEFGVIWSGQLQRHHQIWDELQHHLDLAKHPNAIAVLFRVLLELAVENYINNQTCDVHPNDKLALKIKKVGQDLFDKKQIDKKQFDATKKFGQLDQIVSADTLNRYVHSSDFAPSSKHLEAVWDTMADFVVRCLNS